MAKTFSGEQVVKILVRKFGFIVVSQKGSHAKLRAVTAQGNRITVVPMHKELAFGTLRGVLDLAGIDYKEFLVVIRK